MYYNAIIIVKESTNHYIVNAVLFGNERGRGVWRPLVVIATTLDGHKSFQSLEGHLNLFEG